MILHTAAATEYYMHTLYNQQMGEQQYHDKIEIPSKVYIHIKGVTIQTIKTDLKIFSYATTNMHVKVSSMTYIHNNVRMTTRSTWIRVS